MVLNSFSHVFESDAVVKPLCPLANLFGGCFCLGSGPFCVSGLLFLLTKRKSGWGICGSSGWSLCCLVCCDLPAFPDPFGPCTYWRFTACTHVRTEPQCDIGHTRGKKITDFCMALLWSCCLVVCFTVVIPIPWWCRLSSVWYIADAYELIS